MISDSNSKVDKALKGMIKRDDYLVTQANDLARAFGNLTAVQHKILDFCFSFVQRNDDRRKMYQDDLLNLIHHLGLNSSGDSYKRVAENLRMLDLNTNIYMKTVEPDGRRGILMTHLFDHVKVIEDGKFEFRFSEDVAPYVFQLRENFYSFHLSELAIVKSKYTLTLMKLWNAQGKGIWNPRDLPEVTIEASLEDWESWFLGSDDKGKPKRWPAGRFKQKVLKVAINELNRLYPKMFYDLKSITDKRRVVGYRLDIHSIKTNVPM